MTIGNSRGWPPIHHNVIVSVIFRVYCADHTFCTLRLPVNATAETIKVGAYEKCSLRHPVQDLRIVEVKSNGERVPFRDSEHSIPTTVGLNSCIFLTPKDHMDALVIIYAVYPLSFLSNYIVGRPILAMLYDRTQTCSA